MTKREMKKRIRQDLLNQLKRNKTEGQYYHDLVDDYVKMWETKNKLISDIEERGVVCDYISNNGTVNKKKNESIGEFIRINAQMTKLLESMGIAPSDAEGDDDDEM